MFGAGGSSGGWQYLLTLMPGVAPARGNNQTISANRDSFNGSQLFTSSWLIDGRLGDAAHQLQPGPHDRTV